jgi:hypothetical protein
LGQSAPSLKDEKLNLMHIAICRLNPMVLQFEFFDEEGWPHYRVKEDYRH